jgi:hypothetical protein
VTGLEVTEVAAEMSQIVAGRAIKDNANVLLRFSNGARGTLWASMAAIGNEHGLRIRVYGDRGICPGITRILANCGIARSTVHHRYWPKAADWLSPKPVAGHALG